MWKMSLLLAMWFNRVSSIVNKGVGLSCPGNGLLAYTDTDGHSPKKNPFIQTRHNTCSRISYVDKEGG